jgi:multidrug efflux pump subunit AcrB
MQPQAYKAHDDFLTRIAQHPVAANLLMVMMFIAGLFALSKLNTQFFPNFALDYVTVRVVWPGANPEDVELSITTPIEEAVRSVENLKSMTSASVQGVASVTLEYQKGTDLVKAVDQVKQKISEIRNLPADAEQPIVQSLARYENIASVLLSSESLTREELGRLALTAEKQLLAAGIDSISLVGLPAQRMSIEVPLESLAQQGMTLDQLAARIASMSRDLPSGTAGRDDVARDLRALQQQRDPQGFGQLVVDSDAQGLTRLADLAEISQQARQSEPYIRSANRPAVQLTLARAETGDSLAAAKILQTWLDTQAKELPPSVQIEVFDQSWQLIQQRTQLLVTNGLSGLVLVVLILYLFMNGRVAFWVAMGIPVSFAATLAILYFTGGSINMISLFALIMALGIIVDDAIVVGENALAHYQYGESPLLAAEGGAHRMFWPVVASSLTTIAAFLPLMLVGGVIGNILIAIPIVIISVILASLIECFLILPGHLRASFQKMHRTEDSPVRVKLNAAFERFKEQRFRSWINLALRHRAATLAMIVSSLILAVGLLAGGRISFTFFPSPESKTINMQVVFLSGTPQSELESFMEQASEALYAAQEAVGERIVETSVTRYFLKAASSQGAGANTQGESFGSMAIELVDPDQRATRNSAFIEAWKARVKIPPGVESFLVVERQAGPPGRDVSVKLLGSDTLRLKQASMDLQTTLAGMVGVSDIEDDLPFGKDQWVFELTDQALALGLDNAWLSRQLRGYFDGLLVQIYTQQGEEIEVRVSLPQAQQNSLSRLYDLTLVLPDGSLSPLSQLVTWRSRQGFEVLRHYNGRLAVEVGADVQKNLANASLINAQLRDEILPQLALKHGISYNFEGKAKDQAQTMADMKMGLMIGLALIYIVLAWVFGSYGLPLVVMAVIPFGLAGAIFGHWLLGIDLTILSMFGLFALSGIVVNGSIILVSFYKEMRTQGMAVAEALAEATVARFRAVLLTTLTTVAGLLPLLFETSLQAQFLIPMAVSIAFGLTFATVIVLFLIPVLISIYESIQSRFGPSH